MKIIGSSKRLSAGGWVLAALLLLGYNAFILTSLFSPPIVGRSKETRLASQKWFKLDNKIKLLMKESFQGLDLEQIVDRFSPDIDVIKTKIVQPEPAALPISMPIEIETEQKVELPVLTGIMKILYAHGNHRSFALFEGRRLGIDDTIRQFTIQKITQKGVVLSMGDKTWSVPAPEVYFSLDREKSGHAGAKVPELIEPAKTDEEIEPSQE